MKEELLRKYSGYLNQVLTEAQIKRLFERLERISAKIAPLNTATGNTQTLLRWQLNPDNPNFATENECKKVFEILIQDLLGFLNVENFKPRELLSVLSKDLITKEILIEILSTSTRIGSLELPIWYKTSLRENGKHIQDNIFWMSPFADLIELRKLIGNKNIITKVQVKSYLTDRRQTGDYQTNREIRWESHPQSPQYASRPDCMLIEAKLLAQIMMFTGAPEVANDKLPVIDKAIGTKFEKDQFKCPISGKPIFYNEFFEKVGSPVHGRSGYQIGHMNPLASTGLHTAQNISWITDLGNRVQGESSLEEITNEIFYMANFHKNRLKVDWEEIEEIATKKNPD